MRHDVFISHSSKDKLIADAAVAQLERQGLRCWCAPRDILPGESWATSILNAIGECRALVVIFSAHANSSEHIRREIERAVSHGIPIVPVRVADVMPQGDLEYFLSASHWMDAIAPPLERHFERLATQLRVLLSLDQPAGDDRPAASLPAIGPSPAATVAKPSRNRLWIALACLAIAAASTAVAVVLTRGRGRQELASGTLAPTTAPTPVAGSSAPPPSQQPVPAKAPISVDDVPAAPTTAPAATRQAAVLPHDAPSHAGAADGATFLAWQPPRVDPALADDLLIWQRLVPVHWGNGFFLDHGKQRYAAWQRAADAGDPVGQFFVGCCYRYGIGVAEDQAAATAWMTKAADQGNTDAMTMMSLRCGWGIAGVTQDLDAWFRWGMMAAQRGSAPGMEMLGFGMTGPLSPPALVEDGRNWLRKASRAGMLDADVCLAMQEGLSLTDLYARMSKDADGGHPAALLFIAASRDDAAARPLIARAMRTFGEPYELEQVINPPPPLPKQQPRVAAAAWRRFQEMSDAGMPEAGRQMAELGRRGFKP